MVENQIGKLLVALETRTLTLTLSLTLTVTRALS